MYALCVSGAVNTQGFVWKFFYALYINFHSFIHSFIHLNNSARTVSSSMYVNVYYAESTTMKFVDTFRCRRWSYCRKILRQEQICYTASISTRYTGRYVKATLYTGVLLCGTGVVKVS